MTGIAWLASLAALPICGWALLAHPAFARWPLLSRVTLAGATGAVLLSFVMTLAALAGLPWRTGALLLATVLLAAILRRALPRSAGIPPATESNAATGPSGFGLGAHAAAAAAAAVALALVAAWSGAASSPDLVFFWGPKAQAFAQARTVDPAFLGAPHLEFMHPYYPPLVTNLFAFASMAAGRMVWTSAVLTFPLLLGALALGLPGLLRDRPGRDRAAAASALAVAVTAYAGMQADVGGNGEMPLLVFEALAIALLLSPAAAETPVRWLTGILLAGATATKVEGLPFTIAAAAIAAAIDRPWSVRRAARTLASLLTPSAIVLAAWLAFGATRHLFVGYSGYGKFLDLYPGRVVAVAKAIAVNLLAAGHGLPWIVPALCLLAALPLARRAAIPLATAAVLAAFFLFTYLHRPEDPSLWISWSAARIFSPVAMLLALTTTCGARPEEPETP